LNLRPGLRPRDRPKQLCYQLKFANIQKIRVHAQEISPDGTSIQFRANADSSSTADAKETETISRTKKPAMLNVPFCPTIRAIIQESKAHVRKLLSDSIGINSAANVENSLMVDAAGMETISSCETNANLLAEFRRSLSLSQLLHFQVMGRRRRLRAHRRQVLDLLAVKQQPLGHHSLNLQIVHQSLIPATQVV
jgi:hypothetical protein